MNLKDLHIATITWARDKEEEALLKRSLQQLASLNIPVFITDGGSPQSFLHFLKQFSHFRVLKPATKGLVSQARTSVTEAGKTGSEFVLYTEPDKADFFNIHLPTFLQEISINEHTGICLASRSVEAFNTFPAFQQMTETTINNCCAERIGKPQDYTYGPFLVATKLLPYLNEVPEDIGWGWRPYMFVLAHRLGYNVSSVVGEFTCPVDQRQDDAQERLYRMRQLEQNIRGILLAEKQQLPL